MCAPILCVRHAWQALRWQTARGPLECLPQGPSWSTLDSGGGWKLGHHFARRFYAPLLLWGHFKRGAGAVRLHLVSDLLHDLKGAHSSPGGRRTELLWVNHSLGHCRDIRPQEVVSLWYHGTDNAVLPC